LDSAARRIEVSTAPAIALTLGDPAGIGPEIVVKALTSGDLGPWRPLIVGSPAVLRAAVHQLGMRAEIIVTDTPPAEPPAAGRLYCHPAALEGAPPVDPGAVSAESGRQAVAAIEAAVGLCTAGRCAALVTAPIHKRAIHLAGSPYPGHTEMLAALTDSREVAMMLVGGPLRVALVTIHEPLAAVPELVTGPRIESVTRLTHAFCRRLGMARPRIAVAGLNPHAGEGGDMGREEIDTIAPAVTRLVGDGIAVTGPLPADTLFHAAYRGDFDAVVAMYHDQGLAPLKMIAFDDGVNTTLGLPFPRTSPDHGTALEIAGRRVARPDSLIAAIRLACGLLRRPQKRCFAPPGRCGNGAGLRVQR